MLIARQQKKGFVIQKWTNSYRYTYLHTHLHTYKHTYIQNPKPYIPLQTDIQSNDYRRTPIYRQAYIPTYIHTNNTTSLQPYPTTPILPCKPYPTLHLHTTHTCAIKKRVEHDCIWKSSLFEKGVVYCPPKTCITGRLPKQQRYRASEKYTTILLFVSDQTYYLHICYFRMTWRALTRYKSTILCIVIIFM